MRVSELHCLCFRVSVLIDKSKLATTRTTTLAMLTGGASAFITSDATTESLAVSVTLPLELGALPQLSELKSRLEYLSQHEGKLSTF